MTGEAGWPPEPLPRAAVTLPALDETATAVWRALLALDARLGSPWCLVGGQLVVLHCLEHGVTPVRATDDGDVAVDVFASRGALRRATSILGDLGFAESTDTAGYGYRWAKADAHIDVLVPERANTQRSPARTQGGSRSVETPAAQQAIARAERVPVVVGGEPGWVPRPTLLGSIVVKAAAAVADSRDADRHRQDIAVLCSLAVETLRTTLAEVTAKDRRRLRKVAPSMPPGDVVWRRVPDPVAAADTLRLLTEPPA